MSADVLDFDKGLRLLRTPAYVHGVMDRRRLRSREAVYGGNGGPPPHGGTPAAMRAAA